MTQERQIVEPVTEQSLVELKTFGIKAIDEYLGGFATTSQVSAWAQETLDFNRFRHADVDHINVSSSFKKLKDLEEVPEEELVDCVKDVRASLNGDKQQMIIAYMDLHGR